MQPRLSIITLGVADVATATTFYETVFGWEKLPSSNENITFMQLNGLLFSLYQLDKLAEDAEVKPGSNSGFKGFTLAHNVRSREEVDALVATLKERGATVVKPPQAVFWGGYSSYVADPDGHLWEIAHNPYMELDEAGNVV